ncbi:ABC transporter substrate-binding protein [Roseomonas sp. E05]|uniref:ABC transporter substrate-binding protein n=1 Tax=Roseomonas sp. E05 TaxID=3046310 RepID=UPI0024B99BEA|nr:ABC transporter substrate-binding protein [Roseomonas sp. E05]MDJ0389169.1 ABC transporter substrate-binding protein [Roseomonas sp. E05]
MFERLISRLPGGRLVSGLATERKPLSDTLGEFKLCPDVKFHDGGDFTADGVVFTFECARNVSNSLGGFEGFLRAVERVEVVDPATSTVDEVAREAPLIEAAEKTMAEVPIIPIQEVAAWVPVIQASGITPN